MRYAPLLLLLCGCPLEPARSASEVHAARLEKALLLCEADYSCPTHVERILLVLIEEAKCVLALIEGGMCRDASRFYDPF